MELIQYCRILVESFLFGENFGEIFQFLSSRRHGHFEDKRVYYEQFVLQPNRRHFEENLKIGSEVGKNPARGSIETKGRRAPLYLEVTQKCT